MRTKLFYTALLCTMLIQGAWAADEYYPTQLEGRQSQGPWVYESVTNGRYWQENTTASYNSLNHYAWRAHDDTPITYQFNDDDGTGFTMHCESDLLADRYGVYSLYSHSEEVPAYTCRRLTWNYSLHGFTLCHSQNVALYARDNMDAMKSTTVDFTHNYANKSGSQYLLARSTINDGTQVTERTSETAVLTKVFNFDNSTGDTKQTKTWVLMLTHCAYNDLDITGRYLHQWGSFRDEGYTWTTFYYKHVTFDANGGEGTMDVQTIENSGSLTANAFTLEDYAFAGWATSPDGEVDYADGAAVTADEGNKGPVTLYARWTKMGYTISYDLDGGTASNPIYYNSAQTATFTLSNPTKDGCTFLGWTGSNGDVPQTEVTIANGSTGDRTYTAHWMYTAAINAIAAIEAIGTVENTPESKALIDAARDAYDALTDEQKADVPASTLETLLAAEAAYAALAPSTIRFMNKDATEQVGIDQQKVIAYPALPAGTTQWQPVEKNVSADKTIVIKAVE